MDRLVERVYLMIERKINGKVWQTQLFMLYQVRHIERARTAMPEQCSPIMLQIGRFVDQEAGAGNVTFELCPHSWESSKWYPGAPLL